MQSYFVDLKISETNVGLMVIEATALLMTIFFFINSVFISGMFDKCYTNLQVVK